MLQVGLNANISLTSSRSRQRLLERVATESVEDSVSPLCYLETIYRDSLKLGHNESTTRSESLLLQEERDTGAYRRRLKRVPSSIDKD